MHVHIERLDQDSISSGELFGIGVLVSDKDKQLN